MHRCMDASLLCSMSGDKPMIEYSEGMYAMHLTYIDDT